MIEASLVFFFNDTATTEIYTLSLHDALPISDTQLISPRSLRPVSSIGCASAAARLALKSGAPASWSAMKAAAHEPSLMADRKSTRLNSSHANISYAVFCLQKNKSTTPLATSL